MFDTHCHLNLLSISEQKEAISKAREAGIRIFIVPSVDEKTLHEAIRLSKENEDIFFCAGFHPEVLNKKEVFFQKKIVEDCAKNLRFVGIGETGLDYFYNKENKQKQIDLLKTHLAIAKEKRLPVILHIRDAWSDIFDILKNFKDIKGIFHCFTGGIKEALYAIECGFYISFSGILTYPSAEELKEVAKKIPPEKVFLETDTPYLAPVPFKGKPNRPFYITYLYDFYCNLIGYDKKKLCEIQLKSLTELFGIK